MEDITAIATERFASTTSTSCPPIL